MSDKKPRILKSRLAQHILKSELLRYLGPGFLITIGFIDPGNWATNIEGGSQFNYSLLWVITLGTFMLIVYQRLAAKLGIITGKSLAKNIRSNYSRSLSNFLGVTIILACVATDVAELLGGTIGFHVLFGFPYWLGSILTAIIEFYLIAGQSYHVVERIIIIFLSIISISYIVELFIVKPDWNAAVLSSFVPTLNPGTIYVAMGILGAIVMPHNIYLHSNVIQSRDWSGDDARKRKLMHFQDIDTTSAMLVGWLVNSAMIIVAAAVFFKNGIVVNNLEQASATLTPLAGPMAHYIFGIALLAAGISSSTTSSMAEANVITGFLGKPEDPRSNFYRFSLIATTIPALVIILANKDFFQLLIFSQVVLSVQLPFTIIPLIFLTASRKIMGKYAIGKTELSVASVMTAVLLALNVFLIYQTFTGV